MNQHTPGPWYAWEFEGKRGVGKQYGNEADILSVTQETHRSDAEDASNMLLVAAAPDLLDALEAALAELDTYAWVHHPKGADGAREFNVVRSHAISAVAKARGES